MAKPQKQKKKKKKNPKTIVLVHGCFDLLHIGHISFLKRAKQLGDYLVVGVWSDRGVKKLKGRNPINKASERAEILESLKFVDKTMIFEPENIFGLLLAIKPNIYCKELKYTFDKNSEELKILELFGGSLKYIPTTYGFSTSHLIKRIKENC